MEEEKLIIDEIKNEAYYQFNSHSACQKCYLKYLRFWIEDLYISDEKKESIIEEIKKIMPKKVQDKTCIICSKEKAVFCTSCFFNKLIRTFKYNDISEKDIVTFVNLLGYHQRMNNCIG